MAKKFKFEKWMLGALIVPVAIGLSIYGSMKKESVELGGECGDTEECKPPGDACMDLGEQKVCTVSCSPGCPDGLECVSLNVTYKNGSTSTDLEGISYCFPPALARSLR